MKNLRTVVWNVHHVKLFIIDDSKSNKIFIKFTFQSFFLQQLVNLTSPPPLFLRILQ